MVFVGNQQVGEGWLPGPALLSTGLFDCTSANHLGLYWLLRAHPQTEAAGPQVEAMGRPQSLPAVWPVCLLSSLSLQNGCAPSSM